ncbi:MAG: hypothetical protein ACQ9MH_25070 [Nitrospinales bacterium]
MGCGGQANQREIGSTGIGAIRYGKLKMHIKGMAGGLPQFDMYNIMRDPREELGDKVGIYPYLHAPVPFGQLVDLHKYRLLRFN